VNQKKQKIIVAGISLIAACAICICFFMHNFFFKVVPPVIPKTVSDDSTRLVIAGIDVTPDNILDWLLQGQDVTLLVSSTSAEQEQGLSDVPYLASTTGMLFVFDDPDDYGFWMKDMDFPLDIIWLDQGFRIVHIEHDLSPLTYPKVFLPGSPAKYVIEVNAGFADLFSLKIGEAMQMQQK